MLQLGKGRCLPERANLIPNCLAWGYCRHAIISQYDQWRVMERYDEDVGTPTVKTSMGCYLEKQYCGVNKGILPASQLPICYGRQKTTVTAKCSCDRRYGSHLQRSSNGSPSQLNRNCNASGRPEVLDISTRGSF